MNKDKFMVTISHKLLYPIASIKLHPILFLSEIELVSLSYFVDRTYVPFVAHSNYVFTWRSNT